MFPSNVIIFFVNIIECDTVRIDMSNRALYMKLDIVAFVFKKNYFQNPLAVEHNSSQAHCVQTSSAF